MRCRITKPELAGHPAVHGRCVPADYPRTATALNAGGMTYQKAVDEATKDFLAQGISCVEYANGRRVNIASYAEMALRTCATRAMLMGEARKREALGIDTVLVSQYGACSDTCVPSVAGARVHRRCIPGLQRSQGWQLLA